MAALLDGTARDATALERALVGLVRAAHEAPALLTPRDLAPVRAAAGDGALDYVLVLGSSCTSRRPESLTARRRRP